MKFLIDSAGMLNEPEKRIYKKAKWKNLGKNVKSLYGRETIYEIEINSLDELLEMAVNDGESQLGIVIQQMPEYRINHLIKSKIETDAKFEITCYNSWIE